MAFSRSAGYNNLSRGNFTPTIYSQKVQKFFRKASVAEEITNTDYYGEINDFGDTVNIIIEPTVTVSAYARGQQVNIQDLDDDQIVLTVDQANYFGFKVDDIEKKQAHNNWISLATSSAAYTLKDTYDTHILAYMDDQPVTANIYGADTSGNSRDVGFAAGEQSPLSVLNRACRLLDDQNVPRDNRWCVAKPTFWEQMADENSKLLDVDFSHDDNAILRNGRVSQGLIRGFKGYVSNNMPVSSSQSFEELLFGHMSSTATASQIAKTEVYRDPDSFADIVRGLHLFGRKTLRTNAVGLVYMTID